MPRRYSTDYIEKSIHKRLGADMRLFAVRCASLLLLVHSIAFAADHAESRFQMPTAGEAIAELTLSAPVASWDKPGAEGSVATLTVDGQYNQDTLVVRGAEPSQFKVFLGPLAAGNHVLSV